ncbi:DUF3794 domain-containing protein [Clostridium tarantellae]|uniref:DUF3794 domain-containing protein n=1 Tax=Clostridium tarantellae TaxID=39493 RepID=A0A6I1MJ48_9CLOT|nr:DUF3794 domain-containing protein [Clostridium tarantellae]MPQ42428.1 DUF3794 domain-containing protein [Clostridium tarantellae]
MYCNCSNKNNYEVISLCDIKKFTKKHGPFNNSAWTQISIADVLMLHYTKYYIEKIEKIYVDVSITHTKIIETPISPSINSEGMKLTGKKLLIDGFICSKIVYTSLTKEQTVYTANFTVPFCTYVVIEETADPFNDKYCIKACIEDVFLSLIDCKTVFQNITLFLLAEKKSITCPTLRSPQEDCTINLPPAKNTIIIKNKDNTQQVATAEFNTGTMIVVTTSSGVIPDPTATNHAIYFGLTLNKLTTKRITTGFISNNKDGNNFKLDLNGSDFSIGDILKLEALIPSSITITDFPTSGITYTLKESKEFFEITSQGFKRYFPNIITVKNSDNSDILSIELNNSRFTVNYLNNIANASTFTFLQNSSTGAEKFNRTVTSTNQSYPFYFALDGQSFADGDTITLSWTGGTKVFISNFNSQSNYQVPNSPSMFTIQNNKLSP